MTLSIYRRWLTLVSALFSSSVIANEAIAFKQAFSPKMGWLNLCLAMIALLGIALYIVKKHKPISSKKSLCQVIEKKYLGNKTVVYVIDYQQQRFILADNQHALALYPLQNDASTDISPSPLVGNEISPSQGVTRAPTEEFVEAPDTIITPRRRDADDRL